MGPTGSGKSSVSRASFHDDILVRLRSASNLYQFLESLASKQTAGPLGIAKDQLESVTHSVTCYELVNVLRNRSKPRPLIIIDTPGLADPKISEIQVLKNIKQWREKWSVHQRAQVHTRFDIKRWRAPLSAIFMVSFESFTCIPSQIDIFQAARESVLP
ncbi:hypothetical protein BJ165DRAFT_1435992 [Panaeolus papilionaceus]|nr:hypothetical protein BJ165DRAFT_1435992 [Panaeolus papilionaceus]